MKTVGEILLEKRKSLSLSLEQIEKETKIRKKYLEAIEKNNFNFIPESTTAKGFVRNYALVLGLSPENILAVFRRDFFEDESGQIISRSLSKNIENHGFFWTPRATLITLIVAGVIFLSFFFAKQYLRLSSAPGIDLSSPKEGEVFKDKVLIKGKTDKDATLKVDDSLISISDNGSFSEEIVLPRGSNIVTIETANRQGKKRIINIKVEVE